MAELDPPPAYAEVETRPLAVPKLNLHRSAGNPRTSTVTRDQCAAHLKFLGALEDLRETISIQDGSLGSGMRTQVLSQLVERKSWRAFERSVGPCIPVELLTGTGYGG